MNKRRAWVHEDHSRIGGLKPTEDFPFPTVQYSWSISLKRDNSTMINKIFISQSGEKSRKYAEAIKLWFEEIFDKGVTVFVSSQIRSGSNWPARLKSELKEVSMSFICLTEQSIKSDWVMFEAGALSMSYGNEFVCPLLIDIALDQVPGPLKNLQCVRLHDKNSFYQFLNDVNELLDTSVKKSTEDLNKLFEKNWFFAGSCGVKQSKLTLVA